MADSSTPDETTLGLERPQHFSFLLKFFPSYLHVRETLNTELKKCVNESRGGRPGLPAPNTVSVDVSDTELEHTARVRAQEELCESRGGRPGLDVLIVLTVAVAIKQH